MALVFKFHVCIKILVGIHVYYSSYQVPLLVAYSWGNLSILHFKEILFPYTSSNDACILHLKKMTQLLLLYIINTMFQHHKEVEFPREIIIFFCEANLEYFLIPKEDDVVLAPGDEYKPYQVSFITFCPPS